MVTTPYLNRLGSIISQAINVVVLNGLPDESISARSYRRGTLEGDHKWRSVQAVLDFIFYPVQKNHCQKAFSTDYIHALTLVDYKQVVLSVY